MDETINTRRVVAKAPKPLPTRNPNHWWNKPLAPNLSDDEFVHAALMKRFVEANDPTLNQNRKNAMHLLRSLFEREVADELAAYRKERDEAE